MPRRQLDLEPNRGNPDPRTLNPRLGGSLALPTPGPRLLTPHGRSTILPASVPAFCSVLASCN
jgi:hypothetical protein